MEDKETREWRQCQRSLMTKEDQTESQVEAQSQNLATAPQFDEKKIAWIRLKTDLCMLPFLCLMFFWNQVDRINIGNARVYALEAELKMTGYNFNTCLSPKSRSSDATDLLTSGLSLYFVSYLIFEIPLTIACKYYGPRYFLPAATLLFGIVSFATAYVKSFAGLAGIRFCLGIAEAVIYPGCVYALTLFYTKRELVFRSGKNVYCSSRPLLSRMRNRHFDFWGTIRRRFRRSYRIWRRQQYHGAGRITDMAHAICESDGCPTGPLADT